ncbi:MAG: 3-hydroxyacyl-CoA dehydrogenase family protein [Candidatus Abyssobacteria bacterium SURF_5]|uniref:3-hydroxyacyl-CoA dehydrogenase family protein n=1 Tax=Abyssobacteria bacterium (strain SURF_5) TaxID=2093360 RepID=A0A3A4N7L4_ABYX5|nr:MAG: 3-hydroxyacyl-CoA dehydrogenase family protein [Candidatus Abyssubacteria bacterium SURF_5]
MQANEVKKALIVGAGVMGHSIAQVFAQAGIDVALVDVDEKTLQHALQLIEHNLETLAELGKLSIPPRAVLEKIHISTDLISAAKGAEFALEAVAEVPDVKRKVFEILDEACPPEAILASNTSTLDIFEIIRVSRPDRLITAHWFAPPHIIPLVEVAPGPETAPEVVKFTADLMKRLGKTPVVMKKFVPGYIVNRIQNYISFVVFDMLQNGLADPEQIDLAVKLSLGVRLPTVGVVQTMDFTGLDLVRQITRNNGLENRLIEEKVARGHLGAKTSKGLYDYGGRTEEEILKKRDRLYLGVLDHLQQTTEFKPV